jgi:intracellular sulfur oxidation DsrE/DsrF family protein
MFRAPRRMITLAGLVGLGIAAVGASVMLALPTPVATTTLAQPNAVKTHRIVLLVDSDDIKVMKHAISYSFNLTRYYNARNEPIAIEIVANGAGITLFRADTSPLQEVLTTLHATAPGIIFSVCDSSKLIAEQNEGHPISIIGNARLVPFGIGRLIDLQEAGWTYVHA